MNEKPGEKSESLKKDDTRVPPVQDFLSKPDLTACKVIQNIISQTAINCVFLIGYAICILTFISNISK